jgi:N-acetyltransferase 10
VLVILCTMISLDKAIVEQTELSLPVSQCLALFAKVIRKISNKLISIQKEAIGADIPEGPSNDLPVSKDGVAATDWRVEATVEDELNEAGDEATKALREKQRGMIDALDLSQ